MNILIIDNDSNFANKVKHDLIINLSKIDENIKIEICTKDFDNISHINKYKLLFIDIDLANYNGIELVKKFKTSLNNSLIIFISFKSQLVYESLVTRPFFFVRKSNYDLDMHILYDLIKEQFQKKVFLPISYKANKSLIAMDDIMYVESFDHMLKIILFNHTYCDNRTLKNFVKLLPNDTFVQIHKSYIINLNYLHSFTGNSVTLLNNITLNIGRKYKDSFNEAYKAYLIK